MTGFTKAILLSVAAHILLATCLALYLNLVPVPDVPRLDLSAVEISFSKEPDTKAEAAARTEPGPPEEPKEPDTQKEPDTKPVPAPKQARVDAPPRPLKTIRPDYPEGARQRNEEGDVTLELAISAKGRVDSVTVVKSCGFAELDAAAVRAAQRARFTPAKSRSMAVAATARLTISFKLTPRKH